MTDEQINKIWRDLQNRYWESNEEMHIRFARALLAASAPNPKPASPETLSDAELLAHFQKPPANPSDKQESQFADVIGEGFNDWFQSQKGIAYGSAYASAKAAWDYQEKHIDMMAEHLKSCLDRIEELQLLANPSDKQEAVNEARDRILEQSKNSLFRSGVKIMAAEVISPTEQCDKPPEGWSCSRIKGHEGPCAAAPLAQSAEQGVLAKVLFALTERQKGNVIRSEDEYVDEARAVLKGGEKLKSAEQDRIDAERYRRARDADYIVDSTERAIDNWIKGASK